MSEVYRAMKALDFEWMIMNPYHVLVRELFSFQMMFFMNQIV